MLRYLKLAAPLVLLGAAACTAPFNARVSRFSQLPAPQGQTFTVRAEDSRMNDSLEFARYADMVAQRLSGFGYQRAAAPSSANLVVTLDYGVDRGREKIRSYPSAGYGFGGWGYGPWGRPNWGYGRRAFVYGFYDPFWFDRGEDIESYTVYTSGFDMRIARRDGQRMFEGHAQAQSTDNDLTTLVPNLIEAMFTGFPGNSGETVKITIAPPDKRAAR